MQRSTPGAAARWLHAAIVLVLPLLAPAGDPPRIAGFTPSKSEWERQYEARLKAIADPSVCGEHNRALSEHPSLTGTDWDWRNVESSLAVLRSYGLEPEVKTYDVYMPDWSGAEVRIELFEYPGDPLTPGWAAVEGAHRLDPAEAANLPPRVPTAPLSYGEVEPLLRALGGRAVPDDWQGGLPFTYHTGPGPATVRLRVDIEYAVKPIWDVVVTIPGSKHPDQLVVLGAHRDGWTYGSNDSVSGFVVVMEIARALAELQREGWRPERTIVLGGWDGEETGILGSTEWAEEYRQQLARDAVAYIDLDSAGGGSYFTAAGVPSLDALIYDVAREVEEPRTPGKSVYEDWVARSGKPLPRIDRLGGGYDYEVWIDHLGVPTVQLVFDYAGSGNYHSAYDDLYYLERWGDPGYLHHAAMARLAGVAALRLANADVLPFTYSSYAAEVSAYLDDLGARAPPSTIDFGREISQANAWHTAALALEATAEAVLSQDATTAPRTLQRLAAINERMLRQERDLTQPKGLPGRPWLKHMIYAPGLYTGYAVQTLPALEEALADQDWPKVRGYRALLHDSLTRATETARGATAP